LGDPGTFTIRTWPRVNALPRDGYEHCGFASPFGHMIAPIPKLYRAVTAAVAAALR